ncbi:hypothetical protein [Blastococcus sp. SYSU DS0619]
MSVHVHHSPSLVARPAAQERPATPQPAGKPVREKTHGWLIALGVFVAAVLVFVVMVC